MKKIISTLLVWLQFASGSTYANAPQIQPWNSTITSDNFCLHVSNAAGSQYNNTIRTPFPNGTNGTINLGITTERLLNDSVDWNLIQQTPAAAAASAPSPTPLTTTLTSSILSTDLTMPVAGTTGFPTSQGSFIIKIDNELILVGYTNSTTLTSYSPNALSQTARGYLGTTPAAHSSGSTVTFMPWARLDWVTNQGAINAGSGVTKFIYNLGNTPYWANAGTPAYNGSANPPSNTTLTAGINSSTTTITVASATNFPSSGNYSIIVDAEQMLVTGGQGTTTWTVTRGYNSTTAASHLTSASAMKIDDWQNWITAIAYRYGGGNGQAPVITIWESWNEPDYGFTGTPQQLVQLTSTARTIIKAANPNAVFLGPAFGGAASYNLTKANGILGFFQSGGGAYIDGIALHPYPQNGSRSETIPNQMAMAYQIASNAGYSNLKVYNTEFGQVGYTAGTYVVAGTTLGNTPFIYDTLVPSGQNNGNLASGIGSSDTTMTVTGVNNTTPYTWPQSGNYVVYVDMEQILVTGGQGTTTWTITRGFNGTTAAAHSTNATLNAFLPTNLTLAGSTVNLQVSYVARHFLSALSGNPALTCWYQYDSPNGVNSAGVISALMTNYPSSPTDNLPPQQAYLYIKNLLTGGNVTPLTYQGNYWSIGFKTSTGRIGRAYWTDDYNLGKSSFPAITDSQGVTASDVLGNSISFTSGTTPATPIPIFVFYN
jgi:hypothetical protein